MFVLYSIIALTTLTQAKCGGKYRLAENQDPYQCIYMDAKVWGASRGVWEPFYDMGIRGRQMYRTETHADLDDCFDHHHGLFFADDIFNNEMCDKIFKDGTCDGHWLAPQTQPGFDSGHEYFECWCLKYECGANNMCCVMDSEVAVSDGANVVSEENANAALQSLQEKISSETAVAYKARNDALKKSNKALLNALNELAVN